MSSDEDHPTTVLVLLGEMHFEHAGKAEVLSVKITTKEEMTGALSEASSRCRPSTLDALHVILKSSSVSSLYDDTVISTFVDSLKPGGEATVHCMGSKEMQVQAADVNAIRMGLVMSGLRLESEGITEGDDGGWVLMGRKPGGAGDDDEEEEEKE